MQAKFQGRPDLLLLLSLLFAILSTPVLDRDGWRRMVLVAVTFIPVVMSYWHVTIYLHEEEALEGVRKRYPARQYIQLDEKLLTVEKKSADSVTTMFPPQSKLAHDPAVFAAKPTPDVTVGRVSDLLGFELPASAQHQSTMNRNPNLTRNEVTP